MVLLLIFFIVFLLKFSNGFNLSTSLPIWSRGLAYGCCDIFPQIIIKQRDRSSFLHGHESDHNYFYSKTHLGIKNGSSVYIVSSDLPDFFTKVFVHLPHDYRIIIVSGCEDIGVPFELFHPNRPYLDYNIHAVWPHGKKDITIESILNDNRLHKWFLQNYDLTGCNTNTCSNIKIPDSINNKIIPIPIGIDLHTYTSIKPSEVLNKIYNTYQYYDYKTVKAWSDICTESNQCRNKRNIVISFDCLFDESKLGKVRKMLSGPPCEIINRKDPLFHWIDSFSFEYLSNDISIYQRQRIITTNEIDNILLNNNISYNIQKDIKETMAIAVTGIGENRSSRLINRLKYWFAASMSRYGVAPAGFSTDTHRVWELLQFHCIPIVLTSTLDKLYQQFPIIILNSWDQLSNEIEIESLYQKLLQKFHNNLFNDTIQKKLTLNYWIELIKQEQQVLN